MNGAKQQLQEIRLRILEEKERHTRELEHLIQQLNRMLGDERPRRLITELHSPKGRQLKIQPTKREKAQSSGK